VDINIYFERGFIVTCARGFRWPLGVLEKKREIFKYGYCNIFNWKKKISQHL